MTQEHLAEPIPVLAEHWARKGMDEVEKLEATIALARELLVSGKIKQYRKGENPLSSKDKQNVHFCVALCLNYVKLTGPP